MLMLMLRVAYYWRWVESSGCMSYMIMVGRDSIIPARCFLGYLPWNSLFISLHFSNFAQECHFVMRSIRLFWWKLKLHRKTFLENRGISIGDFSLDSTFILLISFPNFFPSLQLPSPFIFLYSLIHTSRHYYWRLAQISTCLIRPFQAHMGTRFVNLQPRNYLARDWQRNNKEN